MRSTITARGQTVVPAPICERFGLEPSTRLEWIVVGGGAGVVGLIRIEAERGRPMSSKTPRLGLFGNRAHKVEPIGGSPAHSVGASSPSSSLISIQQQWGIPRDRG